MTERQILFDAIDVCWPQDRRFSQGTPALGVLALHQMALARAAEHDFTGAGDLKPFGHRFFRFDTLGTSHK